MKQPAIVFAPFHMQCVQTQQQRQQQRFFLSLGKIVHRRIEQFGKRLLVIV